jgi:hypothetical protein
MKIFIHEQRRISCKCCQRDAIYPVAERYCSAICFNQDHVPLWKWWLKRWRLL